MSINDLQSIADDILARSLKIAPDLEAIELGKEELRAATNTAGQAIVLTSPLGVVKTKKGSRGGATGETVLAFNESAYEALPLDVRIQLELAGVVTRRVKIASARKPSVEISLATATKAAA